MDTIFYCDKGHRCDGLTCTICDIDRFQAEIATLKQRLIAANAYNGQVEALEFANGRLLEQLADAQALLAKRAKVRVSCHEVYLRERSRREKVEERLAAVTRKLTTAQQENVLLVSEYRAALARIAALGQAGDNLDLDYPNRRVASENWCQVRGARP